MMEGGSRRMADASPAKPDGGQGIVVLVEAPDGELEPGAEAVLGEARRLAEGLRRVDAGRRVEVEVWAFADDAAATALAREVARRGADQLRVFPGAFSSRSAGDWPPALAAAAPALVLGVDSASMRGLFPACGLALEAAVVTAVQEIRWSKDHGGPDLRRSLDSGLRVERLVYPPGTPVVAALAPATGAAEPSPDRREAPVAVRRVPAVDDAPGGSPAPVRVVARRPPAADRVDLSEADRIVAGGSGIGGAEHVSGLLEPLARCLEAAVGGTRVISDRGWIPHERYIGSTGKTVSPALYVALGISGASQHVVGLREVGTMVAVNRERTAPIMGIADLAVVGDVHAIAPALVRRLEALASRTDVTAPGGRAGEASLAEEDAGARPGQTSLEAPRR